MSFDLIMKKRQKREKKQDIMRKNKNNKIINQKDN